MAIICSAWAAVIFSGWRVPFTRRLYFVPLAPHSTKPEYRDFAFLYIEVQPYTCWREWPSPWCLTPLVCSCWRCGRYRHSGWRFVGYFECCHRTRYSVVAVVGFLRGGYVLCGLILQEPVDTLSMFYLCWFEAGWVLGQYRPFELEICWMIHYFNSVVITMLLIGFINNGDNNKGQSYFKVGN